MSPYVTQADVLRATQEHIEKLLAGAKRQALIRRIEGKKHA